MELQVDVENLSIDIKDIFSLKELLYICLRLLPLPLEKCISILNLKCLYASLQSVLFYFEKVY